MFAAAAVRTAIHLKRLGVTSLFFCLSSEMMKLPSIMADIIKFILKHLRFHVVIFPNIFLVSTRFPFFMILQFDITGNVLRF